jgi:hypothetical protein
MDEKPAAWSASSGSLMNMALIPSRCSALNSMTQHYHFMPPYDMHITNRKTSKGQQVVLKLLLPSGIADKTPERLDYGIEDSPDGFKSVLVAS